MKVPGKVAKAYKVALKSRSRSYSPYSRFKVGAGLLASDGEIIGGCNIENASYGATICAERVAILKATSESAKKFTDIVVVTDSQEPAFPCALCLQVMAEFFKADAVVWVANLKGIRSKHRFSELLPFPFGPDQLKNGLKS